jgi:hypothetical protein
MVEGQTFVSDEQTQVRQLRLSQELVKVGAAGVLVLFLLTGYRLTRIEAGVLLLGWGVWLAWVLGAFG